MSEECRTTSRFLAEVTGQWWYFIVRKQCENKSSFGENVIILILHTVSLGTPYDIKVQILHKMDIGA